jgi:hypothetical protein
MGEDAAGNTGGVGVGGNEEAGLHHELGERWDAVGYAQ